MVGAGGARGPDGGSAAHYAPVMLRRRGGYLAHVEGGPEPAAELERFGHTVLRGVVDDEAVGRLRDDMERLFDEFPPTPRIAGVDAAHYADFRYAALNDSSEAQAAIAHPRILEAIEPLLGQDCHVIANTVWRNPAAVEHTHGGGRWHMDAGPHVPRPADVPWDDRIPYPVFAIGAHLLLRDCPLECGPTGVLSGSHRSGRTPPADRLDDPELTYDGERAVALTGRAGDVALFVSDAWHRRLPTGDGDTGRFFLQVHYGRRDLAQRLLPTSERHHLSEAAVGRATSRRERQLVGLHDPGFYDG